MYFTRGWSNHGNRSLQKRAMKSKEVPQRGAYIKNSTKKKKKKKPAGQRDQTFRNAFERHSLTSSYLHSSNPLWHAKTPQHIPPAMYVWAHAENGWFINVKRKCRITSSQQNNRQKQKWATMDFYLLFPSRLSNWRSSRYFAVSMVGKCERTIRSL